MVVKGVKFLSRLLNFSRFLLNRPRPLGSFDTRARTQSSRSYGKIEDCEQGSIKNGIIAYFKRIFALKRSPKILRSLFSG